MKFTFKKVIHEGTWRSFQPESHEIKFHEIVVGDISQVRHIGLRTHADEGTFKIRLMVVKKNIMEDNNPNRIWKNITLTKGFDSAQEAKNFLNDHIEAITSVYKLFLRED